MQPILLFQGISKVSQKNKSPFVGITSPLPVWAVLLGSEHPQGSVGPAATQGIRWTPQAVPLQLLHQH